MGNPGVRERAYAWALACAVANTLLGTAGLLLGLGLVVIANFATFAGDQATARTAVLVLASGFLLGGLGCLGVGLGVCVTGGFSRDCG